MALYPKGKGIVVPSTAGTINGVKVGPGTVLSLSFLGGAGAILGIYDGESVAGGTLVAVFTGLNTSIPVNLNPYLAFESGLSLSIVGTFTGSFISLTVE